MCDFRSMCWNNYVTNCVNLPTSWTGFSMNRRVYSIWDKLHAKLFTQNLWLKHARPVITPRKRRTQFSFKIHSKSKINKPGESRGWWSTWGYDIQRGTEEWGLEKKTGSISDTKGWQSHPSVGTSSCWSSLSPLTQRGWKEAFWVVRVRWGDELNTADTYYII